MEPAGTAGRCSNPRLRVGSPWPGRRDWAGAFAAADHWIGTYRHDGAGSESFCGMVREDLRSSVVPGTRPAAAPASGATPKIDHFCALVKDYKPDEMRAAIEKAGIKMGAGRFGMPTYDHGIRLQLLGVAAGLAKTIVPSTRITPDDAAVAADGLDHVVLAGSDLKRSSAYDFRWRIPAWRCWNRFPLVASPPSNGFVSE